MRYVIPLFVVIVSGHICFAQEHTGLRYVPSSVSLSSAPTIAKNIVTNPHTIPANLHTQHFGFFCRQELHMQQAKVPLSFRLGSMDLCNRLEDKPGYR